MNNLKYINLIIGIKNTNFKPLILKLHSNIFINNIIILLIY